MTRVTDPASGHLPAMDADRIRQAQAKAENLLLQAIEAGKLEILSEEHATRWRASPPMPPKWIKMVLFDMDKTFINKHTQGCWKGSIEDLSTQVTRAFRILVPHLIHKGFRVGVVTFSDDLQITEGKGMAGEKLVRSLLLDVFTKVYSRVPSLDQSDAKSRAGKARKNAEEIVKRVYVAAALPKLRNKRDQEFKSKPMPNSKEWHIKQAIEMHDKRESEHLDLGEVMLFDDSAANTKGAIDIGAHGFQVPNSGGFTSTCWEYALKILEKPSVMAAELKKAISS